MSFDPFGGEYNTEDVSAEAIHDGGGIVEKVGWYHVQITSREYVEPLSVEEGGPKLPHVDLKLRVLAGTEASEVDKTLYHTLWLANWEDKSAGKMAQLNSRNLKSLLAFFHAFGTVGPNVFGQSSVKLDHGMYERLEDAVAVVKVSLEKNTSGAADASGKPYPDRFKIQWNNDAYPVDHKRVQSVPKNPDFTNYSASSSTTDDADVWGL